MTLIPKVNRFLFASESSSGLLLGSVDQSQHCLKISFLDPARLVLLIAQYLGSRRLHQIV